MDDAKEPLISKTPEELQREWEAREEEDRRRWREDAIRMKEEHDRYLREKQKEREEQRKERERLERKNTMRLIKQQQEERTRRELELEREKQRKREDELAQKRQAEQEERRRQGLPVNPDDEDLYTREAREREEQLRRLQSGAPVNQSSHDIFKGMDAEIHARLRAKWSPDAEKKACEWIEAITGSRVFDIYESLKSGVILCELINKIRPGMIPKYNLRPITLMERDNIQLYLNACAQLGVTELFALSDLHENKNISLVITNIYSLARVVQSAEGWTGPTLGSLIKAPSISRGPSTNNVRKWQVEKPTPTSGATSAPSNYKSSAPEFNVEKYSQPSRPVSNKKEWFKETNVDVLRKEIQRLQQQVYSLEQQTRNPPFDPANIELTDTTNMEDIMKYVGEQLRLSPELLQKDFAVLNEERIFEGKHVRMLLDNKDKWNQLKLPLVEKQAIEDLFSKYYQRDPTARQRKKRWIIFGVVASAIVLSGLIFVSVRYLDWRSFFGGRQSVTVVETNFWENLGNTGKSLFTSLSENVPRLRFW